MSITERTLVVKDQIHSIGSGRTFNAMSDAILEGRTVLDSSPVQYSDKIVYRLSNEESMRIVFKNDPGRRDSSLVGYRALRAVRTAVMLNDDTMLFQMASNISEIDGTVQTYWTMVTLNEMIKEVPEKLAEKLNSDGVTPGEPLRFEKYVELATKGGIN
jgi:hypothetical protein